MDVRVCTINRHNADIGQAMHFQVPLKVYVWSDSYVNCIDCTAVSSRQGDGNGNAKQQ